MSIKEAVARADAEYAATIHTTTQPDVTIFIRYEDGSDHVCGVDASEAQTLLDIDRLVSTAFAPIKARAIAHLVKMYNIPVHS